MMAAGPGFTVCGGCHVDRQLRLTAPPQTGRTNPAEARERLGGVATNIASQLASWGASVRFAGVQPPGNLADMEARLAAAGIAPWLAPLEGAPPSYTAILAPDGELLIGAAAMALYETVTLPMIRPGFEDMEGALILDANFPADTIAAIAGEFGAAHRMFAVGTAITKVSRLAGALPLLDALVVNRGEAAALLGAEMDVGMMATSLVARLRGGGVVLVSDGGDMAALADAEAGKFVTARPPQIRLVNANGAGDVMAARLFYDLESQPDMALAGRLKAALAAGADYAAGVTVEA